jgi:hypothetical protein
MENNNIFNESCLCIKYHTKAEMKNLMYNFAPKIVLCGSVEKWYCKDKLHRCGDLPAVIYKEKDTGNVLLEEWWINGHRHRSNNNPAIINHVNGELEYWNNDLLHRDNDEPAIVKDNGSKEWVNGKLHRDNDQPAIHLKFGWKSYKVWYQHGKIHRENDLPARIDEVKELFEWIINDRLHRENDNPAVIWNKTEYLKNDNGVPCETKYQILEWWVNGQKIKMQKNKI